MASPSRAGTSPAWRFGVWWISEAISLPATALLPVVMLPMTGAGTVAVATAPFGNRLIFLFLGGFLIALAVERAGFHRRIALAMLVRVPERPAMLVGGFTVVAAGLSMWNSNTATTLMMLAVDWFILCRIVCRLPRGRVQGAAKVIAEHHPALGPMSAGEIRVTVIVALTAALWITGPLIEIVMFPDILTDTGVAIGAAVALFLMPSGEPGGRRLLDWESAKRVPWAVLILVGGGLALAEAIDMSDLADWVGHGFDNLATWPVLLVPAMAVLIVVSLTEVTSNTATSATCHSDCRRACADAGRKPHRSRRAGGRGDGLCLHATSRDPTRRDRLRQRRRHGRSDGAGGISDSSGGSRVDYTLNLPWAVDLIFG